MADDFFSVFTGFSFLTLALSLFCGFGVTLAAS